MKIVEKAKIELNGEKFLPKNSKTNVPTAILVSNYESKIDKNKKNPNRNLLVKNLEVSVSLKELNKLFAEFGEITSIKLETTTDGVSKGYGYVSYSTEEQANKAISSLNGKLIDGKNLEVSHLIPSKNKCCVYAKNFPRDFTEEDLTKFFAKFGTITGITISKNENGTSKGFGFINFANFHEAATAIKKINEQQFTFPSCLPLFVSFPVKKEDRQQTFNRNVNPHNYPKIFARKVDGYSIVK